MLVSTIAMNRTYTVNEIPDIARELLSLIAEKKSTDNATLITLSGDLGAGKTTLTQEIARQLGVTHSVTSPTFVIMKQYPTQKSPWSTLVHIDAYRFQNTDELMRLHWQEMLANSENLIILEWPEMVPDAIPAYAHRVKLSHVSEDIREISFL